MGSQKARTWVYLPFLIALFLLLFQYSHGFPQGDDFSYSLQGGSLRKIADFYRLYYSVDGSRMANVLAQLLLLWDLSLWKVLTPFVILGISLFFFYYIRGYLVRPDGEASAASDFCLAGLCAFFPGAVPTAYNLYGDTFLWMVGSCNYLYPFFFMLAGFLPVYNRLRGRPVPAFFRYASPVLFCVAGLLHEQIALALAGMCVTAFLYLMKERERRPSLLLWCLLSLSILLYTFTCPGAYRHMLQVGKATGGTGGGVFSRNLPLYFGTVFHSFPFWVVLLGLCCLFLLRGAASRGRLFPAFYLLFGTALFAASGFLNLPRTQESPDALHSRSAMFALAYWLGFLAVCLAVLLWAARRDGKNRCLVVLFVGAWASQAIPAFMGAQGRPLLHLVLFTFLIAASVFQRAGSRLADTAYLSAAALGLCSVVLATGFSVRNGLAYDDVLNQVGRVRSGVSDTVVLDRRRFNTQYMYFNSFNPAYSSEIKRYFRLPQSTKLKFLP